MCDFVLENPKIHLIDEALHTIAPDFDGPTFCTKTIYNYVHQELINIKKMDCLEIGGRKAPRKRKAAKRQKGTSIDEQPTVIEDRKEFRH